MGKYIKIIFSMFFTMYLKDVGQEEIGSIQVHKFTTQKFFSMKCDKESMLSIL